MAALLRSLRFRIAMAFVLWTALIQILVTTLLPPAREVFALQAVDDKLGPSAMRLASELRRSPAFPPDLASMSRDLNYEGWGGERLFLALRDRAGAVVTSSVSLHDQRPPFEIPPAGDLADTPIYRTISAAEMPRFDGDPDLKGPARSRMVTLPVRRDGSDEIYYLQVARSLAAMDHIRNIFHGILIFTSVLSILGAGAAGWIVAGRICARLNRISSGLKRISPTNLDERLDLTTMPDEIGRLAAEVNVMIERLAQGFQSQERFISDVSHELKTPVAVLLTEAQALKMGRRNEAAHNAFVLSVEDEMRRLGKLVESFLMLARFGHGRRFLGEIIFSINDVALESVQHSKLLAAQHGVTLSLFFSDPDTACEDGTVRGDPDLVRISIDNLVRNAIQYSKRGDTVSVSVSCDHGLARIAVEDQGRGVPEEYLKTIFDRFAQAPGPSPSGRRGTGLGLAIAKGVVDLHGGTIEVRNRPQGGCAFSVTLPLHNPAPAPQPGPAVPASPPAREPARPSPVGGAT
jgi:signal transduction histidine kinase